MKTIKTLSLILLTWNLGWYAASGQTPVLPLDSILSNLRLNPGLTAYDAQMQAQDAYAAGARSLPAPKVSAGQFQTPYQISPNAGSFMVTAEQMFTNPAKLKAKEAYMKKMSLLTAEEKLYAQSQLIAAAKSGYYAMIIIERKLSILDGTSELLNYMLKSADIRLSYGKEKLPNIYKVKASLYELDNSRINLQNEEEQQRIQLNTLMNRDKAYQFRPDTSLQNMDYEQGVTDLSALELSRSDIRGVNTSIELQRLHAKVESANARPDFGIQAGHMFTYGTMPGQYVLMGSVTIPIFSWSSKGYKANVKGLSYEVAALRQKKADLLNEAAGRLEGLRKAIQSKKTICRNYEEKIIPAIRNQYKAALIAYEQNTGQLQDVMESINALQAARMDAVSQLGEVLQLQVSYERENESY